LGFKKMQKKKNLLFGSQNRLEVKLVWGSTLFGDPKLLEFWGHFESHFWFFS